MKTLALTSPRPELTESQRNALVCLLGDDDPNVVKVVRQEILNQGKGAISWLNPFETAQDPLIRRRVASILALLRREEADNRFLTFCLKASEDMDLEEGAWLMAATKYPNINKEGYMALLDQHATEVLDRVENPSEGLSLLKAMEQVCFDKLHYHGNEDEYYDPDNSYLNRVIDRRTGNPITLCLVYMLVAKRLGLPVVGIGMPGHFICRYQTLKQEYYIDVFNKGRLMTKGDCIRYLRHSGHGFQESYLSVVSPRRMLFRICTNLHQIYLQGKNTEEAQRYQRYLVALSK